MKRTLALIAVAGLAASALAQPAPAQPQPTTQAAPAQAAAASPRIDVVFVLDTTGSMTGLIEGAKQKIWSIANAMASGKPHPTIRMGLVAYRDRGDAYVTKITALTDDLDAVYADLMKFTADGGGDSPESVNQALNEAVTAIDWDAASGDYMKMIYLVGDCPPHMDYDQDVKYADTCKLAATQGITINTIQCGSDASTTPIWQEIARSAEGEYFQIEQSGGVVAIATPMDAEIAKLGIELEATVIGYGDASAQQAQEQRAERSRDISLAGAPAEAMAERAVCKSAGGASLVGGQELVRDCTSGKVDLAKLPVDQLPKEMQTMTLEERQTYVARQAEVRQRCQDKIAALNTQRLQYMKDKLAAEGGDKGDSFDTHVLEAIRKQASKVGITYPNDGK